MIIQLEVFKNLVVDVRSVFVNRDGKITRSGKVAFLRRRLAIFSGGELIGLNFNLANELSGKSKIPISLIESDLSSETIKLIRIALSTESSAAKWRKIFSDPAILKAAKILWAKKKRDGLCWRDVKNIVELNVSRSTFQRIRKEFKELSSEPKTTTTSEISSLKSASISAKNYRSKSTKKRKIKTHHASQEELF